MTTQAAAQRSRIEIRRLSRRCGRRCGDCARVRCRVFCFRARFELAAINGERRVVCGIVRLQASHPLALLLPQILLLLFSLKSSAPDIFGLKLTDPLLVLSPFRLRREGIIEHTFLMTMGAVQTDTAA
ncbi:hypothetical protein K4831_25780 (plasmid) [Agrobacterium vitis]|nr:hypothetical protein [Agrobacterium vitis]QZO07344.1 hypothetical protein K4831_25780 [Agrobacterium vitis]UJL90838.1 hypothetical protein AVF2S5_22795 [Agrobacterium vitis]